MQQVRSAIEEMVESEFCTNRMRIWIHHALLPLCRLVLVV